MLGATSDMDIHWSVCVRIVASTNKVKIDINSRNINKSFVESINSFFFCSVKSSFRYTLGIPRIFETNKLRVPSSYYS